MTDRAQRIIAPVVILLIILTLWEGLVTIFRVEQFLLPRPSVILSNLVVILVEPVRNKELTIQEVDSLLSRDQLIFVLPGRLSSNSQTELAEKTVLALPFGDQTFRLLRGANSQAILQASWFTLKEAVAGLLLGGLLGILVALATARWSATREALLPFAIAANSMPIIAFAPIMNNWFGIDNPFSKIAIVSIMVFFPIMLNTVRGLVATEHRAVELMRSYAASDFQILRKLRIPNALPYFFNGLKVAASLSMIGAIVGEYFGGPRIALGVFITQEAALFRFASAWAAIIVACLIGIGLYLIILLCERLTIPWHVSFRT